ncbi:hypothetical protein Tco_1042490 [Tanacetum coccineum]|uniref:Reverse transcriptase/retrotransposon-derived protein RNase H-like domain-containing protein n=1 Tax=Tanacetum coccineum TaxID=301880 RepID=A0ABQ5GKG8_9ASTR
MRDVYTTLSGLFGEQVKPLGEISLLITLGEALHHRSEQITFLIVRSDSPNNMLLGRMTIARLGMIPSTMHSTVLYQSEVDQGSLCQNTKMYPEQTVTIGRQLPTKAKQELIKLLKDNADVFAWQYSDMTGIPRTLKIRGTNFITKHKLNEDKKIILVQQKKRRMAQERAAIASKEVEELRKEGILEEARFLSKSVEKSLPLFKTLKGCLDKKDFTWIREADKAFKEMKRYIDKLPILVAPKARENLIVYLAASKECISAVLMPERGKD